MLPIPRRVLREDRAVAKNKGSRFVFDWQVPRVDPAPPLRHFKANKWRKCPREAILRGTEIGQTSPREAREFPTARPHTLCSYHA